MASAVSVGNYPATTMAIALALGAVNSLADAGAVGPLLSWLPLWVWLAYLPRLRPNRIQIAQKFFSDHAVCVGGHVPRPPQ